MERAIARDSPFPRITVLELRHVAAGLRISQGVNVSAVSRQLGHANPSETLNRYATLFDAAVRGTSILNSARRPDTKSHHALIGWFAVRVVEVRASIRNNISPPTCHRSQLTHRKHIISVSMSRGEYPQSFLKGC